LQPLWVKPDWFREVTKGSHEAEPLNAGIAPHSKRGMDLMHMAKHLMVGDEIGGQTAIEQQQVGIETSGCLRPMTLGYSS